MWQFFETGTFYLHIKMAESSSQQPDSSRRVQAAQELVYGTGASVHRCVNPGP